MSLPTHPLKKVNLSAGGENDSELLVKIQRECWSLTVVLHLAAICCLAVMHVWVQAGLGNVHGLGKTFGRCGLQMGGESSHAQNPLDVLG